MKLSKHIEVLEVKSTIGCVYPVLISCGNDVILVDAAYPNQFKELNEAIIQAGFIPNDITKIIFTHQDIDHIGTINELKEHCPNLTIMAHTDEIPYLNGTKTPIKVANMEANLDNLPLQAKEFFKNFKLSFENRRFEVDLELNDGEIINDYIEIIHTPGHTPGHICLYLKKEKILISGDALNVVDGILTGPNEKYTQDMDLAYLSVEKLKQYDIDKIICYHGGITQQSISKIK